MSDLDLADIAPHELADLRIELSRLPNDWRRKFERLLDVYEDQQDMVERSDYDAAIEERDEWEGKANGFEEERDSARVAAEDKDKQIDELQAQVYRLTAKLERIRKTLGDITVEASS